MHSRHFLRCGGGEDTGEDDNDASPGIAAGGMCSPLGGAWADLRGEPAEAANNDTSQLQEQQQQRLHSLYDFAGYPHRGFTADDFTLDDPYHEDSIYVSLRAVAGNLLPHSSQLV
jgi:hypothetical protein